MDAELERMWEEIKEELSIGEEREYNCGCRIIYEGKDKHPRWLNKCDECKQLSNDFHQARATLSKLEQVKYNSWTKLPVVKHEWQAIYGTTKRLYEMHLIMKVRVR